MKKLSLVLALILVFTCCAFVACGDDTDTSSDAGSSAVESSDATSSDAASSEDASSEDASSEDASSEDASSEDASSEDASSEDASSEDASSDEGASSNQGTAVDNPTGTNVALNKPYTGGDVASASPTYSANLTDGKASNVGAYDSSWFGLWFNADATVESNNAPGGIGTIVVDLGQKTDGINAVRVNLYNANASGIVAPESITAYISDDGNNFTELGALVLPEGDDPAWASLALNNVSGQYVKLVVKVGGTWTFLNEIEVYA